MLDVVTKAAENVGGVVKLAEALGIKHPSFHSWKRVPAERALEIARLADVHPSIVRSDLYPAPSDQSEPAGLTPSSNAGRA